MVQPLDLTQRQKSKINKGGCILNRRVEKKLDSGTYTAECGLPPGVGARIVAEMIIDDLKKRRDKGIRN